MFTDGYPERLKVEGLNGRVTVAGGGLLTVEEEDRILSITPDQCELADEFIKRMKAGESKDNTDKRE